MKKISFDIEPSEKQMEFFMSEARFTAYGGARGGGKSWALRYKLLLLCLNYPGIQWNDIERYFFHLSGIPLFRLQYRGKIILSVLVERTKRTSAFSE